MHTDELRRELRALADEREPSGDVRAAMSAGHRRLLRRRVLGAGVALAVVVVIAASVSNGTSHHRVAVVTPTTVATPPVAPSADLHATGVVFTSAAEGWICDNPAWHTADGGGTWQRITLPLDAPIAACGAANHDAWFASMGSPAHLEIVQGGSDGEADITLADLPSGASIVNVSSVDRGNVWVLARKGNGGVLLHSANGGLGMRIVSDAAPLGGVTFSSATDGWGIGHRLFRTIDGGRTWSEAGAATPPPVGGDANLTPYFRNVAVHGSTVMAEGLIPTGNLGQTFFAVSHDLGRTWAVHRSNITEAGTLPSYLALTSDRDARLAFGDQLWISADAGSTWAQRALPPSQVSALAFPTNDQGWMLTSNAGGTLLYQTTDAGRTWQAVSPIAQRVWTDGKTAIPGNTCDVETPTRAPASSDAAVAAARDFVKRTRGWLDPTVGAVYRVSDGGGQYGIVFSANVARMCGQALADASYGVELDNPAITLDNSRQTAVLVAHFSDGWKVWGFYR
ncbi:MAG TPA: hypothetical protein VFR41_09235 [Acidimicrobiia bacterium]|nr:hypothetical protein [Acidimicrobiia bacterium]